jgi:hypothetical protein
VTIVDVGIRGQMKLRTHIAIGHLLASYSSKELGNNIVLDTSLIILYPPISKNCVQKRNRKSSNIETAQLNKILLKELS